MKKRVVISLAACIIVAVAGAGLYFAWELISTGAAYKAKILCSGFFVSRRTPESVLNSDLAADDLAALRFIGAKADRSTQTASSGFLGLITRTAAYRPGLGCTLVFANRKFGKTDGQVAEIPAVDAERSPWPEERPKDDIAAHVDPHLLEAALDWAFLEPDSKQLRRTRAVVIVHRGQIVGERYAPGFDRNTPLIGWSMTKSVMNALVGILVAQHKLSIADHVHAPEWQASKDARNSITVDHLLRMSSGLAFDEDYSNPLADVTRMLLRVPDMATYAANKNLLAGPGSRWSYSSGTTNILSRVIRQAVGDSDYLSFPRRALFGPLGMDSAVIEPDASGTFVGSSFMYATARDWAKFGLLYLRNGIWDGQRILPEGWVSYSITPAAQAADHGYGAHFWLTVPEEYAGGGDRKRLPEDAFHAVGAEGQFVTVIPSHDLVIVRLGLSRIASAWQHDTFIKKVLEAVRSTRGIENQ